MDVTEGTVRNICTDAVFERGERYLAEDRILDIHRVDTTVTAVVNGNRQYDARVDLAADGFDLWCDCPYDGPGACKHVVSVLLRCVDDCPPDEGDRLDAAIEAADVDDLRDFLRETLATDVALRERFFARFGEPPPRSVDDLRAAIDRQFEETNPDYFVDSRVRFLRKRSVRKIEANWSSDVIRSVRGKRPDAPVARPLVSGNTIWIPLLRLSSPRSTLSTVAFDLDRNTSADPDLTTLPH